MTTNKTFRFLFVDYELPDLIRDEDYPHGPTGGAALEIHLLIKELMVSGHDVALMTWQGAAEYLKDVAPFKIIEVDLRTIQQRPVTAAVTLSAAVTACRRYKPDYVIGKCATGLTGLVAVIADLIGAKFIYRFASDVDANPGGSQRRLSSRLLFAYALHRAAAIFCQTNYQYTSLKARFPTRTITTVADAIEVRDAMLPILPFSSRRYIAWLGRFAPEKNLQCVLELARELPHVQIHIAGAPGRSCDAATRATVQSLRQCRNVVFVGYLTRSQVSSFLQAAHALLSTSNVEGFPRTFLEALAAGTPIVTTERIDPDSIVAKHDLGVVAHDHRGLKDAIVRLLNRCDFNDLADRCRTYVVTRHDSETFARRFISALH